MKGKKEPVRAGAILWVRGGNTVYSSYTFNNTEYSSHSCAVDYSLGWLDYCSNTATTFVALNIARSWLSFGTQWALPNGVL